MQNGRDNHSCTVFAVTSTTYVSTHHITSIVVQLHMQLVITFVSSDNVRCRSLIRKGSRPYAERDFHLTLVLDAKNLDVHEDSPPPSFKKLFDSNSKFEDS